MKEKKILVLLPVTEEDKEYFISRMLDIMNTVFVPQTALELLEGVTDQRDTEMPYYYKYLEKLRNAGDRDVWSRADHLKNYMNLILTKVN